LKEIEQEMIEFRRYLDELSRKIYERFIWFLEQYEWRAVEDD